MDNKDKDRSDGCGFASAVSKRKRTGTLFLPGRTTPPTKTAKTSGDQYSVGGKTTRKKMSAVITSFFHPTEGGDSNSKGVIDRPPLVGDVSSTHAKSNDGGNHELFSCLGVFLF